MGEEVDLPILDEATHTYTLKGVPVPGVTSIIASCGFYEFPFVSKAELDAKAELGRLVHKAAELYDLGTLDWTSLDDDVLSHFEGWVNFLIEHPQVEVIENEQLVYHPALRYCGTLDRVILFEGRPVLADIKIGAKLDAAAMQTAAYRDAYNWRRPQRERVAGRMSIHLPGNGKYRIVQHQSPGDFSDFCACYRLYQRRIKNAQ